MNKQTKKRFLYMLALCQIFFLTAGESFDINDMPENPQENKPTKNTNTLEEMNKRHQAERKNLEKTYNQKEKDLEKERAAKKKTVTTTNDRVRLSGPAEGKTGNTTSQASKVDEYYDNQLKQLRDERKRKMNDLKNKQNAQHDAEVEKQLATNDALNAAFKASSEEKSKKAQSDQITDLGKGIDANKKHSKILQELKETYDNKISKLESQYKTNWDRLNNKKEFAAKTATITIDNKVMTGDEAEQYYVDKINELKTKLDADKKQALDAYTKQKQAQQQALEQEARNIFKTNPKEEQVDQSVMTKDLSQVTPRQIEKFVNQFSKDVIPDLSAKQKQSLRDVISSLQEQVGAGESINTILQNDRENITEKLQLSSAQKTTFENNYATIDSSSIDKTGFFEALLELLRNILSN